MSLDAGSVFATLGGRFSPSGFNMFGSAMLRARHNMESGEKAMVASAGRTSKATEAMGRAAKFAAVGGFAVLGAATIYAVKQSAAFNKQMSEVKAVTGATERQMKALTKAAKDMGAKTGIGATEAAKGIAELAKGGISAQKIIGGGLKGAIALAQAGSMDLADAASTVANALNLFGLKGSKATHVADALAKAANDTTADVSDFAMALSQGGGAAHAAGLSFDDTVTALEALAKAGVKNSDAGTSLKTALIQLASPTKQQAELTKKLGLNFFDTHGKMKPLPAVADMLREKLGGLDKQQRLNVLSTIAGTDGFRALLALMTQGGDGVKKLEGGLKKQGTAQDVAKQKMDNLSGSTKKVRSEVQGLAIDAGDKLQGPLKDASDAVGDFLEDARKGTTSRHGEQTTFGKLKEDTEDLRDAVDKAKGPVGDIASKIGKASVAVGGFELKGIGLGLEGVTQTVEGALKTLDGVVHGDFSKIFSGLGEVAGGALKTLGGFLLTAVAPIRGVFNALGDGITSPIKHAVSTVLGLFSSMLSAAADAAGAMAKIPGVGGAFKGLAAGLRDAAGEIDNVRHNLTAVKAPPPLVVSIEAAVATRALRKIQGTKLEPKVMMILGSDTSARTKIRALETLGIKPKVARVLADVAQALGGVTSVAGAIAALRDRTVTISVRKIESSFGSRSPGAGHASGRGPGGSERAWVGEGRGPEWYIDPATGKAMRISGPTVMDISPSAYVIPTESAYAGRALGLFSALGHDLGIAGYAKGKKPKKKHRPIPHHVDHLAYSPDELDSRASDAESRYNALRQQSDDKDKKGHLTAKAKRAKSKLAQARADLRAARQDAGRAKDYAGRIQGQEEFADIAADQMGLADRHDDQGAYDAAKKSRVKYLNEEKRLLRVAFRHAPKNSAWYRELAKRLGVIDNDLFDANAATQDVPEAAETEADRIEETGMTDAERARLADLDAAVALAALTPDLGDDTSAASQKVGLLEQILGEVQAGGAARGGSPVVADIAGQLKSARDNLTSLTNPGGSTSNDNADVQAQIEQANQRASTAAENNRLASAALAAFTSAGDIGAGGPSAYGVVIHQTNNMLIPSDPAVLRTVGDTAVAGIGLQPSVPSPRVDMKI